MNDIKSLAIGLILIAVWFNFVFGFYIEFTSGILFLVSLVSLVFLCYLLINKRFGMIQA